MPLHEVQGRKTRLERKLEEMYSILTFEEKGDERGNLIVAEGDGIDIPFAIKRVFYMYGSDIEVVRGQHANKETEFVLVNVCGTSKVKMTNGKEEQVVVLDKPRMGLYLKKMLWKEMYDFSPDSILLVLASGHYDENEYIRDYNEYLAYIKDEHK